MSQRTQVRYLVRTHTLVSPSADLRRAVISYWQKYVHEVLVNRVGGLSLPRNSVVRLTDRHDMTIDVYCGRKTTTHNIATFAKGNNCHDFLCVFLGDKAHPEKGVYFQRKVVLIMDSFYGSKFFS